MNFNPSQLLTRQELVNAMLIVLGGGDDEYAGLTPAEGIELAARWQEGRILLDAMSMEELEAL